MSRKVLILGGGISGLTAAYRLTREAAATGPSLEVRLLEAADRPGGVIGTRREDGYLIEEGPDSFLSSKPWAVNLCGDLGLERDIIETSPEHRRSFIVQDGELQPVPRGFYLLAPASLGSLFTTRLFTWRGKIRIALELLVPRKNRPGDESLEAFVTRRLGREAFERMAQPMIAGIYGADPGRLSIQATFPQFLEWEQQQGSVIRALQRQAHSSHETAQSSGPRYSLFVSLRQGLESLVQTLVERLPPGCLTLGARVTQLGRESGGAWRADTASGDSYRANALCVALPAPRAADLLAGSCPELAQSLHEIPYLGSISVNLVLRREQVGHPLDGMGFVVPAVEGRNLMACSFSSIKFPGRAPEERVLLRAFLGGPFHQQLLTRPDPEIEALVLDDLLPLLRISGRPLFVSIRRHPESMPQYHLGHLDLVARIEEQARAIPGLVLAGGAYRGVGIPDCVRSGEEAAAQIFRFLIGTSS